MEKVIQNCPLRKSLNVLGGKWNLIIIKTLGGKELRFSEIKRKIPDLSEKVLIEKLKLLVNHGLLIRKDFKEVPPKVTYQMTDKGLTALNIVELMEEFSVHL